MKISFEGAGLHTGRFFRVTLDSHAQNLSLNGRLLTPQNLSGISAHAATVIETQSGSVWTTEHLFAALAIAGIYQAEIQVEPLNPFENIQDLEIPLLDGSALSFVELFKTWEPQVPPSLMLPHEIRIQNGDSFICATPCSPNEASLSLEIDFPDGPKGSLEISLFNRNDLEKLATARTFGFLRDRELLENSGLAKGLFSGAISQNAVLLINKTSPHSLDEPVRHKALDFIGDLMILGRPVAAKFVAYKNGHALHHAWLRAFQAACGYSANS